MDAIALLCTLHADGPATLKRLRQAGCDSIQSIGRMDADRLASLLDTTPAAARRFLREAAHLAERVDAGFFEREERGIGERTQSSAPEPAARGTAPATSPAARERSTSLGYRDQRIVAQVLEAWRKHDADARGEIVSSDADSAPDLAPESGRLASDRLGVDSRAGAHGDVSSTERVGVESRSDAHGGAGSVDSDLSPGAVDGLDADMCRRLRAADVHTIDALARADALALANALGIGYTRLARLCALARRVPRVATTTSEHAVTRAAHGTASCADPLAEADTKFSRAGTPSIGVMSALAEDLEIHAGPKPPLPSRTRWFPASATSDGDASGPFA